MSTQHRAAFTLALAAQAGASSSIPDGHLERINALQAARGKPNLSAEQVLVRPVRLFGNKLTSYFTRIPDQDLRALADQINGEGGPVLSAHVTDETPRGTFYAATVVEGDFSAAPEMGEPQQELWLDTWFYVLNDAEGQRLCSLIDGGVINEASIGYWYEQLLCSITGGPYWDSPYWRGNTYTITDPETGAQTEKLCWVWTTGNVQFAEGSLVYRGAYPGTKVGGDAASPNLLAASKDMAGPTAMTKFQMAASKDLAAAFDKKPDTDTPAAPSTPPPVADTETLDRGGEDMKITLKLKDGSVKEVAASEEAQEILEAELTAATERGTRAHMEATAAALGLEPKDATTERLQKLAKEAAEGRTYREDLLTQLQRLSLAVSGTGEAAAAAADRAKRAYASLELSDIRDEVARLTALRDGEIPAARLSVEVEETPAKTAKRDLDSV